MEAMMRDRKTRAFQLYHSGLNFTLFVSFLQYFGIGHIQSSLK